MSDAEYRDLLLPQHLRSMSQRKHFILPDTQVKPGVLLNHFLWAADAILEYQPDVLVHLGDHWDMQALSMWDKGKMAAEGRAYEDDIAAGNKAMDILMRPIRAKQMRQLRRVVATMWKQLNAKERNYINRCIDARRVLLPVPPVLKDHLWALRCVFTIGNHEQRIERHIEANPELRRTLGYHSFNLEEWGWEVHDFLHPVTIDGLAYQHYIPNPNTGRPWGGMVEPRVQKIGYSFVSGHEQGKKSGERYLQNKRTQRGLVVGSYYLHDEGYKGPQGNYHWRGCVVLHNVGAGDFDIMELRMGYLAQRFYQYNPKASREELRYVVP